MCGGVVPGHVPAKSSPEAGQGGCRARGAGPEVVEDVVQGLGVEDVVAGGGSEGLEEGVWANWACPVA